MLFHNYSTFPRKPYKQAVKTLIKTISQNATPGFSTLMGKANGKMPFKIIVVTFFLFFWWGGEAGVLPLPFNKPLEGQSD